MSAYHHPNHPIVDWPLLLPLLRRHVPLARIGEATGMCERSINRLARGEIREPRFGPGLRLLDLASDILEPAEWERVCRSSRGINPQ